MCKKESETNFMGTSDDEVWDISIFNLKEGSYYYVSENSTIKVTDHEYLNVGVLEERT